jgi:hypothetical protein
MKIEHRHYQPHNSACNNPLDIMSAGFFVPATKGEKTMEQVVYYVRDFCRIYSIPKTSFYREVNAKRLRVFKRGKRTMIERAEAERWIAGYAVKNPINPSAT